MAVTRGKILVVDDEPAIREMLETLFRKDHDVVVAPDGAVAAGLIKAGERYEVILCDVRMPRLSGPDFLQRVTEIDPEQADRIIFMTANPESTIVRRVTTHLVLQKPFGPKALKQLTDRIIEAAKSGYFPKRTR